MVLPGSPSSPCSVQRWALVFLLHMWVWSQFMVLPEWVGVVWYLYWNLFLELLNNEFQHFDCVCVWLVTEENPSMIRVGCNYAILCVCVKWGVGVGGCILCELSLKTGNILARDIAVGCVYVCLCATSSSLAIDILVFVLVGPRHLTPTPVFDGALARDPHPCFW